MVSLPDFLENHPEIENSYYRDNNLIIKINEYSPKEHNKRKQLLSLLEPFFHFIKGYSQEKGLDQLIAQVSKEDLENNLDMKLVIHRE